VNRARGLVGGIVAALVVAATSGPTGCGPGKGSDPGPSGGSGPPTGDTGGTGGTTSGGGNGGSSGGTSGSTSGGGSGGSTGGASGSDGSPACAGLTASLDAGHARRFANAPNESCWRATSAPGGQVALGILAVGRGTGTVTFHLLPPDGSSEQGTIAVGQDDLLDVDRWFHFTSDGWAGLSFLPVSGTPYPPYGLASFDDRGNRLGLSRDAILSSAPDGQGGSVALGQTWASGNVGPTQLEWLDAHAGLVRSVTLDQDGGLLLSSWGTGHVLVLGGRAPVRARWYDAQGEPLTPWFDAVPSLDTPTLHLLVDGSIAIGDLAGWRGVFRDGVASMDPPPAWLAARPFTRLATIRGGRGYAVLPLDFHPPGVPWQDETKVEILSASGESCGTIATPAAPGEAGVTRQPSSLGVGQDGTLFEMDDLSGPGLSGGRACEFRWWPAALR
jgi:hypothetical protein